MTRDRLRQIELDVAAGRWVPSPAERELGAAIALRTRRLQADPEPADMPAPEPGRGPWLTQALTVEARLVAELEAELLPVGRARLPDSPMLELLEMYVARARALVPYAARLSAAWRQATPRPDDIGRWEQPLAREVQPLWPELIAIGSVIGAAATGDIRP